MVKFLDRLYDFGKISLEDHDRELGKHFGYPPCCVEYYLRFNAFGIPAAVATAIAFGDTCPDVPYVKCPVCRGLTQEVLNLDTKMPTQYFGAGKIIKSYRGLD